MIPKCLGEKQKLSLIHADFFFFGLYNIKYLVIWKLLGTWHHVEFRVILIQSMVPF